MFWNHHSCGKLSPSISYLMAFVVKCQSCLYLLSRHVCTHLQFSISIGIVAKSMARTSFQTDCYCSTIICCVLLTWCLKVFYYVLQLAEVGRAISPFESLRSFVHFAGLVPEQERVKQEWMEHNLMYQAERQARYDFDRHYNFLWLITTPSLRISLI